MLRIGPNIIITHLTHGRIALFCHFSRRQSSYTAASFLKSDGILGLFEAAHRTLVGHEHGG